MRRLVLDSARGVPVTSGPCSERAARSAAPASRTKRTGVTLDDTKIIVGRRPLCEAGPLAPNAGRRTRLLHPGITRRRPERFLAGAGSLEADPGVGAFGAGALGGPDGRRAQHDGRPCVATGAVSDLASTAAGRLSRRPPLGGGRQRILNACRRRRSRTRTPSKRRSGRNQRRRDATARGRSAQPRSVARRVEDVVLGGWALALRSSSRGSAMPSEHRHRFGAPTGTSALRSPPERTDRPSGPLVSKTHGVPGASKGGSSSCAADAGPAV